MDRGLLGWCVEYAADPDCPKADFFLTVIYEWVARVARDDSFECRRRMFDGWLDVAKGIRDGRVKDWRHRARLIFQGVEPFDPELWQAAHLQSRPPTD